MSASKLAPAVSPVMIADDDPVERAFRDAPVDERPLSEAAALREARDAGGPFVSHAEVVIRAYVSAVTRMPQA